MLGRLISKAIKVTTLPIDAANVAFDVVGGGDGSKRSRNYDATANPLSLLERIRDNVADSAEEIDD